MYASCCSLPLLLTSAQPSSLPRCPPSPLSNPQCSTSPSPQSNHLWTCHQLSPPTISKALLPHMHLLFPSTASPSSCHKSCKTCPTISAQTNTKMYLHANAYPPFMLKLPSALLMCPAFTPAMTKSSCCLELLKGRHCHAPCMPRHFLTIQAIQNGYVLTTQWSCCNHPAARCVLLPPIQIPMH